MKSLLKRYANSLNKLIASPSRPRPRQRVRLNLEIMEDRAVPSITSPNGQHTADILYGQYGSGFGWYVLKDQGPVGGPYLYGAAFASAYQNGSGPHYGFSANSQHLVWTAHDADGWHVVEDSSSSPAFLNLYTVGFSPDSRHYAFVVQSGAYWSVYVDFRGYEAYLNLHIIGFSANSCDFTYGVPTAYGDEIHTITLCGSVADTVTTVGSSVNPSVYGQPVTFTATVRAVPPGSGTPSGTVTFIVDGQNQTPVALNGAGQASLALSGLGAGSHVLNAKYNGGTGFSPSPTSAPLGQSVGKASSTTTLSTSASPSVYGQPVTFTATVRAVAPGSGIPSGPVTFVVDGQPQGPVALNGTGQASLTLAALSVGQHTITASYGGGANFVASPTSAPLGQSVQQANSITTLSTSASPSIYGQPVTFTATVRPVAPSSGTPTGAVIFLVDGQVQGPVALNGAGQASLTLASLVAGPHTISASYGGDANFAASPLSAPLGQMVNLALSPATLPQDTVGDDYSATISAAGGSGTYSFVLVSGTLPAGLSLSSAGVLSGRATTAQTYSFTVKATDTSAPSVTGTLVCTLLVNPAPLQVQVSAPSAVTAGITFAITVTARDAYGNGYSGSATLASSDGQTVTPATITLTNGTATVGVFLRTAGTTTLTATARTFSGSSDSITVNPAALARFVVAAPSTATAGTPFTASITAEDTFGNTVTSFNGSLTLFSTDGQHVTPASVTLSNGTASPAVTLNVADTTYLGAGNGVIAGYSALMTVHPATINVVVHAPSAVTAGAGFAVIITARDAYNNPYTGVLRLTSSDGQVLIPAFTLSNGAATVGVALRTAGTFTLTVAGDTVSGSSDPITVSPNVLAQFAVAAPGMATAGTAFTASITAEDAFGNTVTSFNGSLILFSTDGQHVMPANVTLSNGTANPIITLTVADPTYLGAGNGVIAGYSHLIVVHPADIAVVVHAPSAVTAGAGFAVSITARDAYNNPYTGVLRLTSSDGQVLIPAFTLSNGAATVGVALRTAGTFTLTVTGDTVTGSSDPITVNPAAATQLVVAAPSKVGTGIAFSVTITAEDAFGNTVTNFNGSVNLFSTDGQLPLTSVLLTDGTATITVTLFKAGTLRLGASNGVIGGYSDLITVNPGRSSHRLDGLVAFDDFSEVFTLGPA